MQRKLNATAVRNAKPKPDGKPNKLTDGGGLYLLINKAGKYWRYNYRYQGKQKTLALGTYPEIKLKEARERHEQARTLLARDVDPSEFKQAVKAEQVAKTQDYFEAIATEWFMKFSTGWTVGYKDKIWNYLQTDIFPYVGTRPISEIEPPDVLKVCNRAVDRGTVYTAHIIKQIFGEVFRYAVATGRAKRDPAADLKGALPAPKTTHFATITKPSEIGGSSYA